MIKTVLALYDNLQTADSAVQALLDAKFNAKQISLVANDVSGQGKKQGSAIRKLPGIRAAQTAGIGSVLIAGPVAKAMFDEENADAGRIVDGLKDLGAPDAEAQFWAEGVRRGGALTCVDVEKDDDVALAEETLNRFNPINLEDRSADYQKSGWKSFDATSQPYTEEQINDFRTTAQEIPAGQQQKLNVVEEELKVGKREVEGKKVRVNTRVTTRPVEQDVTLHSEQVTVERHPVDRPASTDDLNNFQDATIELTEKHEEPVVSKTARVVEEVVVGKQAQDRTETVRDTVRRKDVDIQGTESTSGGGYAEYQTRFRTAFSQQYAGQGTWEQYEPAYHFGYNLANDSHYQGREWAQIEADAKKQWEATNPNTWEGFKGAVRSAWDNVTSRS